MVRKVKSKTMKRSRVIKNNRGGNKCYRCGRLSHYADNCYASRHINGYDLD